jgi:hypothetical protein
MLADEFLPDPLHLCIALGPLAAYLIVLGGVNLRLRPLVVSGPRDLAALAVAVSGLVVAGPMELFMVEGAAQFWGPWVWVMLLAAYALGVVLLILLMRPRLIVYHIQLEQLRPVVAEAAARLDPEVRWAGDSLVLPQLGVQLHLDALAITRNVALVSSGPNQNLEGWRRLERELRKALARVRAPRNPAGVCSLALGLALALTVTWQLAKHPGAVAQALSEMLRL